MASGHNFKLGTEILEKIPTVYSLLYDNNLYCVFIYPVLDARKFVYSHQYVLRENKYTTKKRVFCDEFFDNGQNTITKRIYLSRLLFPIQIILFVTSFVPDTNNIICRR